jgi:peptidoglycan/LPS O-acetylase OafA/YrhL
MRPIDPLRATADGIATAAPEAALSRHTAARDLPYVGALDGLRAIAVAAVVVFHFAPSVLPGGFLGVDVFFVVSGFLIARLVAAELARTGRVSLSGFWGRRARRLLPALVTTTIAVTVAAALGSSDAELRDIRPHALGTLFYGANWVMIAARDSYFATIGRPSPFLHMWTLAVEEQFYVVLPLAFVVARRTITRRPQVAAAVALAGAAASTIWMAALYAPDRDPTRAYLGSDSHAMGLLAGVALGVLAAPTAAWEERTRRLRSGVPARVAGGAAMLALVGVVATMRLADDHSRGLYRGGFGAFALACVVLVGVVATVPGAALTRALGARPLVAVGLRSYSLYLWHWPVRVFVTPDGRFDGAWLFTVRLAVSVVLAELSFRLVERPFRTGVIARRTGSRGAVLYYAAFATAGIVLVSTVAAPKPLPERIIADTPAGRDSASTRVDIFGDSTALVFGYSGARHGEELDLTVGGDARLGCGVVLEDHLSRGRVLELPRGECEGWEARWRQALRADPHAIVAVMTGAWEVLDQRTAAGDVRFGTTEWTELVTQSLRRALRILTADGRTVHLFEVPCYGEGDPRFPLPERGDPRRIAALNTIFARVAAEIPGVEIVPWRSLVCPGGRRAEHLDGVRLWEVDGVHLTAAGAVAVWRWWLARLRA